MAVTIRDVAKLAGVSVTTVSRALNGYSDVSRATREKVVQAAQQLNFRPSQVARNLVTNRTHTVGLLISEFNKDAGGHHFLFDVMAGVHEGFAAEGYDVTLVSTTSAQQRLVSYVDFCTERRFEGVVVMGIRLDDPYMEAVVESPLPSVVIDIPLLSKHCGYIMTDNVNGARFAVRHLFQRGHRRIGFVNGHLHAAVSVERRRGYEDSLRACGLVVDDDLICESDFTIQGGADGLRSLLRRCPDMTAVFFASDLMAIGGMRAAQAMGLRIPDDLAMVGFDNIDITELITPTLTTVAQPRYDMGVAAASMLIGMISKGMQPQGSMMSPELIVRQSS